MQPLSNYFGHLLPGPWVWTVSNVSLKLLYAVSDGGSNTSHQ